MTVLTLINNFHNTSAKVYVANDNSISETQRKRVKAKLCGVQGCNCGGYAGERGGKWIADDAGYRINIIPR